jgi:glutamyl-tRNA reductase
MFGWAALWSRVLNYNLALRKLLTGSVLQIFALGVNYETAPLELRERVAFDDGKKIIGLSGLKSLAALDEALILSTCNRTEVYFHGLDPNRVIEYICDIFGLETSELDKHLYVYSDCQALEHAARVASGLDSMVTGETQIFGQFKDAYREAQSLGSMGPNLHKFFELTFSIAKEVRSETTIGKNSISLASAALRVTKTIFNDLQARRVLFVGAGEMIDLCVRHFSSASFDLMGFSNRSIERAEKLSSQYSGLSHRLSKLSTILHDYDVIVSCTGSPVPILKATDFSEALKIRKHYPVVVFDLAVPRDIETDVANLDDVFLYSIDDLGAIVRSGMENREQALIEAQKIVKLRSREFDDWRKSRLVTDAIKAYRNFGEQLVQVELVNSLSSIQRGDDPEAVIRSLAHSIKNKFLDRPSRFLRESSVSSEENFADPLLKLFNLTDEK